VPCKNADPDRMVPKLAYVPTGMPTNFTCLSDSEVIWTHYGPYENFKNPLLKKMVMHIFPK